MRRTSVFSRIAWLGVVSIASIAMSGNLDAMQASQTTETPGSLLARGADGEPLGLCPLVHTDVKGEISGILSRVTVRQDFLNSFKDPIEAVYTFPLPHNAVVDDMMIHVGSRTIRGVIKRREEARAAYEHARAQGKLAALLDQERPNIFSQQVANILPGQNVEVTISYVETLKYENGGYRFVFPMAVGPRYIPGQPIGKEGGGWAPDTNRVPDASRITPIVTPKGIRAGHDISIEVSIDSGVPLTNLRSTQHEIVALQGNNHSALVRLADRAVIPNKDFILSYDVAGATMQDGLVAHRLSEDGYFMLILQPPLRVAAEQVVPKELVFVLDSSGSMQGFPIEKAKETMKLALDGLYPHDTFNLITFSGDTRILFPQPVPATPANLAGAQAFLVSTSGSGGTEMMRAVRAALEPSDAQGRVRIVCFMTDGLVGNDMEILSEIQRHPNARVFAFGIGSSPNRFLLDRMVEEGRGAAEYVTLVDDAAAATRRFHERIRNPLLTDISLDWSGLPVTETYPRRIPDLFSAEPVVVCGRYSYGGSAILRLSGKAGTGDFMRDIRVPLPKQESRHEVLAKLWARERIDALMAEDYLGIQRGNPRPEVKEAIIDLGLQHRLMTQFTSFVAVEERVVTEGGSAKRIEVPVEMPEGVSYQGVFGTPVPFPLGMSGVAGGIAGGVAGGVVGGVLGAVAPAPKGRSAPIGVGGNVQESKLIRKTEPVYPELAKKAGLSAEVILEASVNEKGDVSAARVLRGHPLLNDAAVAAVKQWKYSPTLLNGNPVPVVVTATVVFKAQGAPRLDQATAMLIARIKAGGRPDSRDNDWVRNGKAEVTLTVDRRSEQLEAQLRALSFEIVSWQDASTTVTGRIAIAKLESLLDLEAVRFVAPLRHQDVKTPRPKGAFS